MIWRAYFWLVLALILASILVTGFDVNWRLNLIDWLNLAFMVGGLAGVYGYAYKRRLASKSFWTLFTIFALAYQLAYSFVLDQRYGAAPATSTADGLTTFVPLIPMFIAMYLYVFRSKLLK